MQSASHSASQSRSMPSWDVSCAATALFQSSQSSAMTIASGMPTPFLSFETPASQDFRGLCDGGGTVRACLVAQADVGAATDSRQLLDSRGHGACSHHGL